ncbi:hypothetical protein [Inediibacterium massiliense]|uniref:hypothetical protein n=1 Tax=Inediibacterium massiliense TaxID=1658111 RepID=UPI0006B44479|nr:hypothetical protein [Inediibacterium massiliense]
MSNLLLDLFGIIICFGSAGLICIKLGKSLNNKPQKTYIDQETGEQVILKRKHTLFFVKIETWRIIYIVFGIILLIATIIAYMS